MYLFHVAGIYTSMTKVAFSRNIYNLVHQLQKHLLGHSESSGIQEPTNGWFNANFNATRSNCSELQLHGQLGPYQSIINCRFLRMRYKYIVLNAL